MGFSLLVFKIIQTALLTKTYYYVNENLYHVCSPKDIPSQLFRHRVVRSSAFSLLSQFFPETKHSLFQIQCVLQDVSANIATPKSSAREAHHCK